MLQLQSKVTGDGQLTLALVEVEMPVPRPHEVVVRVEAAPINPSDLGLLLGGADVTTAAPATIDGLPAVVATVPSAALAGLAGRLDQSLPCGNEGAGVVVATGDSPEAQALMGRTVAGFGGGMYSQFRAVPVSQCLVLNEGTTPEDGASCFVNPLTALGMVDTMRSEGHTALLHTAAASNLGQMLVKICAADGVGLVNVVRRPEQADLLRSLGATHVCDSSQATFTDDLVAALTATGATIAFDATGGGRLADEILSAMETAAMARAGGGAYNRYGTSVHKQVYLYGRLSPGPTELNRTYGMSWAVAGWLLTNFLVKAGPERAAKLRQRVADEIHTTFASRYTKRVGLAGALDVAELTTYSRMATGEKYLVLPQA